MLAMHTAHPQHMPVAMAMHYPGGGTGECPRQRQCEDEERVKEVDVVAGESDH